MAPQINPKSRVSDTIKAELPGVMRLYVEDIRINETPIVSPLMVVHVNLSQMVQNG